MYMFGQSLLLTASICIYHKQKRHTNYDLSVFTSHTFLIASNNQMQRAFTIIYFAALFAVSALAQSKEYAPSLIPGPQGKQSPPLPVHESDRKKACPKGFEHIGKQCVKAVSVPADVVCPTGTVFYGDKCATFVGKNAECPPAYTPIDGGCARSSTAQPQTDCPHGYILTKEGCTKRVQGPSRAICPGGTVAKGDQCVRKITEGPKSVCPSGYTAEDNRCTKEETFDCTPPRQPTKQALRKGKDYGHHDGKKGPTTVEEYVIQSTCKRVTNEPARKECQQGQLEGKVCIIEVNVEPIIEPGKYREEIVPPTSQCPPGYSATGEKGVCINTEYAQPAYVCPGGTNDLGDRCAVFSPSKTVCPPGFALDDERTCVKTIFAAPVVEYTVTYACTGKNCGSKQH